MSQQAVEAIRQRTHHTETQLKELMGPTAELSARLDALALESKDTREQMSQTKDGLAASTAMLQQALEAACSRLTAAEGQVAEITGSQQQQLEARLQNLASNFGECQQRMTAAESLVSELQEGTKTAAATHKLHEVILHLSAAYILFASR